ncbi:MAG: hypothetical protein HRT47_05390 [Candidatus Caenarcaniphilales bacterium]|nr:hypothetical protein [Candidatus Caenarcaniphilales bacterium]
MNITQYLDIQEKVSITNAFIDSLSQHYDKQIDIDNELQSAKDEFPCLLIWEPPKREYKFIT